MNQAIFPANKQANYEEYGYSAAIKSKDLLFISGQVGVDDAGAAITDTAQQFAQAFANLGAVLTAAGADFSNIVDVTTFHVDMYEHFDTFATAKQKIFPTAPFPNWTAIGVTNLANPALLLETKAIARLG